MADGFDYVKVNQADAPEPFSVKDLISSMSDLDLEAEAPFVGVLYGAPGTRKTTRTMELAQALCPTGKKILYVYTGQGWTTLKNFPKLQYGKNGEKNVKAMPFIRYEQIETLRAVLMNPSMREKMQIGAVVFDEYNRMQDMDTDQLTRHRAKLVNNGTKVMRDKNGVEVYKDPDTPEWPEYNTTKLRLINLLNDIFTIPETHFFFVCHTRFQKGTGMIEPDFPEKTGAALISMVHSIYYCDKVTDLNGKTAFPIELVGTDRTVSKNRIGGLPNVVYDTKPIIEAYQKWGNIPDKDKPKVVEPVKAKEKVSPVEEPIAESPTPESGTPQEDKKPDVVIEEAVSEVVKADVVATEEAMMNDDSDDILGALFG